MTNNVPFLTGGIFFSLLLTARKTRQKARNKLAGGSDNLRDTDLMYELNYVLTGDEGTFDGTTIKRATSNYKKCETSRSTYIELDNPENKKIFSSNKNNPEVLIRISRLIDRFLGNDKKIWLAKALLETIYLDKNIDDDYSFDIGYNLSVNKTKFTTIQKVCLPIFIFSILRFILENRTNNHLGKQTFYEWHTQNGGRGNWIFNNSCLGDTYSNIVDVFTLSENQIKQLFQYNLNPTTLPEEVNNDPTENTIPTSKHSSNITNNFFSASDGGTININTQTVEMSNGKPLVPLTQSRFDKKNNTIIISGTTLKVPIAVQSDAKISKEDEKYIKALYDIYSELTGTTVKKHNIDKLPPNLSSHLKIQNKSYFAIEQTQRAIRDVFSDGEYQMDILKEDAFNGVEITYISDYSSGLERLNAVLEKITTITLNNSTLKNIIGLIGNLEKRGICHILVNDDVIKSWVNIDG